MPGNSVANVAGNPITTQAFNHWMYVAAKSQAAQSPGQPVIVPNDPPNFDNCVAQVRKQIPTLAKTATKTLRADCKQLFTSLSSQVMDFLIKAYWYQAEAAKQGIKVTDAQVQKAFNTAKNQQFPTAAAVQHLPHPDRPDARRTSCSASGSTRSCRSWWPSTTSQGHAGGRSSSTTTRTSVAVRHAGDPQHADRAGQEPGGRPNAAKKALQSGQSWDAVAKKYSTDPTTKNNGGLLTGVTKGQEDPALDTAAFSAPLNKLLGPVKGQFGYYVFEVHEDHPGHAADARAGHGADPASTLTSQQQQTAQTAVDNQAKKDWLSQTTCRAAYAMADCKRLQGAEDRGDRSPPGARTAPSRHHRVTTTGGVPPSRE